jgi:predicted RNA-binding Zn ribbon-like protein
MTSRAPRYDIPNAAPEPLRLVQTFVNTVNLERNDDWLVRWFGEQGLAEPSTQELDRARVVREAIRELLYENNRQPVEGDPRAVLNAAADGASFSLDFSEPALVPRAAGADGAVGRVLAVAFEAMSDGKWPRLKACRNHHCRWAFYDYSKNRSASWCSMQLCGNRRKIRAYRERHARA